MAPMKISSVRKLSKRDLVNALVTERGSYANIKRVCDERVIAEAAASFYDWVRTDTLPKSTKTPAHARLTLADLSKDEYGLIQSIRTAYKPLYMKRGSSLRKVGDWTLPLDEQYVDIEAEQYLETFKIWSVNYKVPKHKDLSWVKNTLELLSANIGALI